MFSSWLLQAMAKDPGQMWHKTAAGPSSTAVVCNLVAHFFVARFFDGEAIQVRAHLITAESEDTAHSHASSFFSYLLGHCVSGAYGPCPSAR